MRIGVAVYSSGPSGVPVAVLETALALRGAGVQVTVFATHGVQLPADAAGLRLAPLEPLPGPLQNPRVEHALHLPHRLMLGRRVASALRAHPVDLLHAFSPGIAALVPRGQPVVVQSWFTPPTLAGRLRTMLPLAPRGPLAAAHLVAETEAHVGDRLGYRRADLVLANTEPAAERLRARGLAALCQPPPVRVPERPPEREPGSALRLVFCAYNLATPRKGLRHLLDALPRVAGGPLRLTLVGGGSDTFAAPIERARRAGVEVVALGRVERERYLRLLAKETDLLVMPSLYEEWGYALFEALSQGVPALTFERYPFTEVLDERLGLMAAGAGDPDSLARCLERALAGELPEPATVHAATRERFGAEALAPRLLDAYERVAS